MMSDISRVRRFARFVTAEVGALDTSFLGRGRPLGVARVLNAIGHGRKDVADIRAYLGLDSGLMSRILRGLEEEELITVQAGKEDARRRRAELTDAGRAEFAAYEALSDERAESVLASHPNREVLLEAMDVIASALGQRAWELREMDPADDLSRYCLGEYYAELNRRFESGFEVSLSADPDADDLRPPRGSFLVALSDELPLGCVALKGTDKGYAEIKRLWVASSTRGLGLAKRLMQACEDKARALGYPLLRLDTNKALPEAVNFYRKTGWTEIDRFNDDPYPDFFFEKAL